MRRVWAIVVLLALAGCLQPGESGGPSPEPVPPSDAEDWPTDSAPSLPTLLPAPPASSKFSSGAEPSVLTDRNGQYVWLGDTSGGYWSTNNGTTWTKMPAVSAAKVAFNDGWALAQDEAGNLYVGELSDNHIDVAQSKDGGRTWAQTGHFAAASVIADRPWMAAKGNGEVVLFYYDFPGVGFPEHCARSVDGGFTFLDRHPTGGRPQGGKAFYDDEGRFYYSQSNGVLYRFGTTCSAGAATLEMIGDAGHNIMIQADVEGTDLYMAAAADDSRRIVLAGSKDFGPVRSVTVSPADLRSNTFATVSVHEGVVAVAWYGSTSAGDPSGSFSGAWNVYLSIVHGFWDEPTVHTMQVTKTPNHHGTICMGGVGCTSGRELLDYFMVEHDIWGGLHLAYVDDVTAARGSYHLHIPPEDLPGAPPRPAAPPKAAFLALVDGLDVDVDASFAQAAPGENLTSYEWDWGDGSRGEGVVAQHTYPRAGAFQIRLTVRDTTGQVGEETRGVIVEEAAKPPPASRAPTSSAKPPPAAPPTASPAATREPPAADPSVTVEIPAGSAALALLALLAVAVRARRRG